MRTHGHVAQVDKQDAVDRTANIGSWRRSWRWASWRCSRTCERTELLVLQSHPTRGKGSLRGRRANRTKTASARGSTAARVRVQV